MKRIQFVIERDVKAQTALIPEISSSPIPRKRP